MNYIDNIRLDDCFTKDNDLALMNGVQALVRLLIEQAKLDKDNGLVTHGYVSGYPGSPLGTLDLELGRSKIEVKIETLMMIDSLQMTNQDRQHIVDKCKIEEITPKGGSPARTI